MALNLFLIVLMLICSQTHGLSIAERELMMRTSEEEAAKNSILMYDKDEIEHVETLIGEIRDLCQCEIDHLSTIQGLILHYKNASHIPASDFHSIKGILLTDEDHAVTPPDDEIEEDSDIGEERLVLTERQTPNDPRFSQQWALGNNAGDINWQDGIKKYMSDSQGASPNGPKVVVAVLDTGVDYFHPDLRNEMWKNPNEIANNGIDDDRNGIVDDVYGANFAGGSNGDPMDGDGHGTHCSGIIAATANNGQGVAGVAGISKGKVKIMAVKVLGSQTTFTGLISGLNYAIAKGAKISSHSYGCANGCPNGRRDNQVYERILRQYPDHLFISAAGNDGRTATNNYSPAGIRASNAISVASSDRAGRKSSFSTTGSRYIHVFAPGSDIWSTYPRRRGSYRSASGTSMACPMVSGLAALVRSMRGSLNGAQVKQLIEQNVQKKSQFSGLVSTGGLIDVDKTIGAITGGGGGGPGAPITTTPSTPACADQPGRENWCQRYSYACAWNESYDWFRNYCKKTCDSVACSCPKPCNNRYRDSYCCRYKQYCNRLPATHWFVRGCAGTCNRC